MKNRLSLALSLFGMILALHLWVQQSRDFDQGCLGMGERATNALLGGCHSQALQKASHLFGVSNAAWGYWFFFAMAAFALGRALLSPQWAGYAQKLAGFVVCAGFSYSAYLLYFQVFVAKAICPLCALSSLVIFGLFAIHARWYLRDETVTPLEADRLGEIAHAGCQVFVAAGVTLGLMVFQYGIAVPQPAAAKGERPPIQIKSSEWISADTPRLGGHGPVAVITFLDPNCPHCGQTFEEMQKLAAEAGDQASFYVLPCILWDYSVPHIEALQVAGQQGKYYEFWSLQFKHQKKGGWGSEEIASRLREVGVTAEDPAKQLEAARAAVAAGRDKVRRAGINSTPTIFIDGEQISGKNRAPDAMLKKIDAMAAKQPKR